MGIVSGSWEDIFEQAIEASEAGEAEADALFDRLITRLNKLSDKALLAGDGYLVGLRDRAVAQFVQHLLDNGRARDALVLTVRDDHKLTSVDARGWGRLRALVLMNMGRYDEAGAVWVELVTYGHEDWDQIVAVADPEQLQESIVALIGMQRFAAAAQLLRVFAAIVAEDDADPEQYDPILLLRALLYASLNRPEETIKTFTHLLRIDASYANVAGEVLAAGWRAGFAPEDVLRVTEHRAVKKANDPQVLWWRAFALAESGKPDLAHVEWREIATDKVLRALEGERDEIWVYALAQYFLGDPKSLGIAAIMDSMRDAEELGSWEIYAAAGLGWAREGDIKATRLNLILAVERYWQQTSLGRQLPPPWRTVAQRLVSAEVFAEIEGYFAERSPVEVEELPL